MSTLQPAILAAHFQTSALIECAAVAVILAALAIFPPIRRAIWAPTEAVDASSPIRPMRRKGIVAAYLLIIAVVGGSLLDLARDTEHWPWSNFPMYSQVDEQGPTFEDYRLYGVLKSDQSELCLSTDARYLQPFDPSRLAEALIRLSNDPRLKEGLLDCLKRYEYLRQSGAHNGPPLTALRMYRVRFTLDPWGRNTEQPDQKSLICQVSLPAQSPS